MTIGAPVPAGLQAVLDRLSPERLEQNLWDMLEIYSPPYAEGPVVRHTEGVLRARGFDVTLQPVPNRGTTRANVLVQVGPGTPTLLWVGHLDTVELFHEGGHRPRRDGDLLRGLGTADMKGGCAAAIEALTALMESGEPLGHAMTLALVVGEEDAGDGALVLRETLEAPLTVIGEPTSMAACVDHYSYIELLVEAHGKRAHAALPEVGANAIHAMLEVVSAVLEDAPKWPDAERIALSVRRISGGEPQFVIAEQCEAQIDVHLPPGVPPEGIEAAFERAIAKAAASHDRVEIGLRRMFWAPGFGGARDDTRLVPLQAAFASLGQAWEPTAFRSHSDANLFHDRGTLTVVCGPGDLDVAHRRSERVSLTEVHAAARLYASLFWHATR